VSRDPLWTRSLLACYPAAWRRRYGDEYVALLSDSLRHTSRARRAALVTDVLRGALDARLNVKGPPMADRANAPTTTAIWATGLFTVAAGGFFKMIDDATLITASHQDTAVGWSLLLLKVAAAIALLAMVVTALPTARAMLGGRAAGTFKFLTVPPIAAALWFGLARVLVDRHSANTTPDVVVVIAVSVGAVAVVAATAWSASTVLRRVPADSPPRLRPLSLRVLAVGMAATTLACLSWGLAVHSADPSGFSSRTDGLFARPFEPSWIVMLVLMAVAATIASVADVRQRAVASPA
jgi:hypothetical protein